MLPSWRRLLKLIPFLLFEIGVNIVPEGSEVCQPPPTPNYMELVVSCRNHTVTLKQPANPKFKANPVSLKPRLFSTLSRPSRDVCSFSSQNPHLSRSPSQTLGSSSSASQTALFDFHSFSSSKNPLFSGSPSRAPGLPASQTVLFGPAGFRAPLLHGLVRRLLSFAGRI